MNYLRQRMVVYHYIATREVEVSEELGLRINYCNNIGPGGFLLADRKSGYL